MFAVNINGTGLKKKSSQKKEKNKTKKKSTNQTKTKQKNPKSQNDVGATQTGENTVWSRWAYSPGQFLVFFFSIQQLLDTKHKTISDHLQRDIMKPCFLLLTLKDVFYLESE